MNANAVVRNYGCLTAEERFRLILAASERGDGAERDRLARAGQRLTLSVPDYCPFAHAFQELALLTYIELLEDAAGYQDANKRASEALDDYGAHNPEAEEDDEQDEGDEELAAETAKDAGTPPPWERFLQLAYAAGFVLRTKADGWKLFCARLSLPPLLLWEALPGFDRLQRALALSEKAAFLPEGFLCWLNRIRPAGKPEFTSVPLTVEGMADAAAKLFRERAAWWGG